MRIYHFEDIGIDLGRQPLAVLRALRAVGVALSPQGWAAMTIDARTRLCQLGAEGAFAEDQVQDCLRGVDMRRVRMVERSRPNPKPSERTQALLTSLSAPPGLWERIEPLDRWVLRALSEGLNSRLFQRAYVEIARRTGLHTRLSDVTATIARCELWLSGPAVSAVRSPDLEEGRALVLARASGLRAARQSPMILDHLAEVEVGPIEVGATMWKDRVLWQAHASSVEGVFLGTSSLLCVAAAAVALGEMLSRATPPLTGHLSRVELREDVWAVGADDDDELTRMHPRGR
ncbi:MAG: hypothetical protein IT374_23120 [Polyangiaceae bacterium]|nr:hypothetical protein [Polyangiaceae bacterium]